MFEGVVIADRYRLDQLIGQGAMGEVWRGTDRVLGRTVAVKLLRFVGEDAADVNRMVREARTASSLNHPNAVAIFDLQMSGGRPFLIMEFVDGESLAQRLRREQRLNVEVAANLICQVGRGLQAAHEAGIVHRDIKPANVLINRDGVAKLADFGIARATADTALTQTGQMLGTVSYMAPEVARGSTATAASDIWSLGATCFAAVEGFAPFGADPKANAGAVLMRLVSEPAPAAQRAGPLAPLLAAMLDNAPDRRPPLMQVLTGLQAAAGMANAPTMTVQPRASTPRREAAAVAASPPTTSRPPTVLERPAPMPPRRRRTRVGAIVGAAAIVATGTTWGVIEANSHGGTPRANPPHSSTPSSPGTSTHTSPKASATPTASLVDANANPHTVVGTIRVGTSADTFFAEAVSNDGKSLYLIGYTGDGTLTPLPLKVLDPATHVSTTIPLNGAPAAIITAPHQAQEYVSETDGVDGRLVDIAVLDSDSERVSFRIPTPQHETLKDQGNVGQLAVSGDGKYLFVTEPDSVAMINLASRTVKYLTVHNGLGSVSANSDGTRIYVVSMYEQSVDVIQTSDGARLATLKFAVFGNGVPMQGIVTAPDGKHVYAYGENDGGVSGTTPDTLGIVDTTSNGLTRKDLLPIDIGSSPLKLSPTGRYLYVTGVRGVFTGAPAYSLNIVNLSTYAITKVPLNAQPGAIAVSPDGRRVYVTRNDGAVSVIG